MLTTKMSTFNDGTVQRYMANVVQMLQHLTLNDVKGNDRNWQLWGEMAQWWYCFDVTTFKHNLWSKYATPSMLPPISKWFYSHLYPVWFPFSKALPRLVLLSIRNHVCRNWGTHFYQKSQFLIQLLSSSSTRYHILLKKILIATWE